MEKQQEDNHAAINKEDRVLEHQETPERKYIDALLDISEESFMRDLQPYEDHCYSGWEHAVRGWARVSPMSCILMNQKNQDKAKHEEADNPATLVLSRTLSKAGSKDSLVEQYCKSHAGLPNIKEAGSMNHRAGPWGPTEWPVHNTTQKYLPGSFFEGKMEKKGMLRETTSSPCHLSSQSSLSGSRALKAQKHTIRDVTVVPIKNLTFLPPIISPQTKPKVNTHVCRGKKTPDAKIFHKPDKRIGVSWTQLDIAAYSDLPVVSTAPTLSH